MSSNPCNYMDYGVETIKRQPRAAFGCLVAGKSPWARAKPTAYRLYARSVWQKKRSCSCNCGLWSYTSVMCLPYSSLVRKYPTTLYKNTCTGRLTVFEHRDVRQVVIELWSEVVDNISGVVVKTVVEQQISRLIRIQHFALFVPREKILHRVEISRCFCFRRKLIESTCCTVFLVINGEFNVRNIWHSSLATRRSCGFQFVSLNMLLILPKMPPSFSLTEYIKHKWSW